MPGGVYKISQTLLSDLVDEKYGSHASNLGAQLGLLIAKDWNVKSFIVDPVSTDDFPDVARVSGVPGIERKSRSHALNIKYCYYKTCEKEAIDPKTSRYIICHLGSGVSVAAVVGGKIIDVNDALLGMGPFSVERAGALPLAGILSLIYQQKKSQKDLELYLSTSCGMKGYLGTNNFKTIEKLISQNAKNSKNIFNAMVYQIVKEIGSCFGVLNGDCNGLILTGGLANSLLLLNEIKKKTQFIKPVFEYLGSFELEALATSVSRVLKGQELARDY